MEKDEIMGVNTMKSDVLKSKLRMILKSDSPRERGGCESMNLLMYNKSTI